MNDRITLQQIGEMAGVSSATVSRVLNNHPHVSGEVRGRVQEVMDRTGYRPNPAARTLAGQKSNILSLVIPETAQILFTDPYFAHLAQGMAQACQVHDYALSLFIFHAAEDEAKIAQTLLSRQIFDGAILTATQIGDPLVSQLADNGVPFVLVGQHEDARVSFVDADNVAGAYTAVSHLIHLGYERIGAIIGPQSNLAALHRYEGYTKALRDWGRPLDERLVAQGEFLETGGYAAMRRLLAQRPQAIFAASDAMAIGALRAVQDAGLAVPDDVALIGYDDLPHARMVKPQLTTVRQPIRAAGIWAVETLMDILRSGLHPARRIVLPTELVVRDTCGARRLMGGGISN